MRIEKAITILLIIASLLTPLWIMALKGAKLTFEPIKIYIEHSGYVEELR